MKLRQIGIKFRLRLKKLILDIRQVHLKDLRNAFLLYLKKLPNIVHLKNLVLFNSILAVVVIVMFYQRFSALAPYYQRIEPARGGFYREGVIGNIEKINPLFTLNSAEDSAVRLVFSGLTRVLPNDQVVPDLAERWESKTGGVSYEFYLKKGIKWHDGQEFKADDVIYTITLMQNPDTKTNQSVIWKGVSVEKINDYEVRFTLKNAYPDFLEVAAVPILPKHLLREIDPKNVKIAEFNKSPIGTGPYKFVRFDQSGSQTEVIFEANDNFAIHKPYIKEVRLKTYENFDGLYNGLIRKQIDGITDIPYEKSAKIEKVSNMSDYKLYLPRYQLLIFNLKNKDLTTKELRQALSKAVNRKAIIDKAARDDALAVYSAILPGQTGYDPKLNKDIYNADAAKGDLEKLGWKDDGSGVRKKDGQPLEFRLVTGDDYENRVVAAELQTELAAVGAKLNIEYADISFLQANYIRPRNYDILLVGQDIGKNPDLYSFWHSSQIADPGLNLSGLKSREIDKLLELARKSTDSQVKARDLIQVQEVLANEVPAVFLYNPSYTFALARNVKGFAPGKIGDPVDHLNSIYDWYTKVKISY